MIDSKDILAGILSELGQNTREFSDNLGYSLTKLYDVQRGKTKRLSDELIELILEKYPRFNKVWLMTGEGEMLQHTSLYAMYQEAEEERLRRDTAGNTTPGCVRLPLVTQTAVAGFGNGNESELQVAQYTDGLSRTFNISLWTLLVPLLTGILISRRVSSVITLEAGGTRFSG